jgi:hypothetical protein
MCLWGANRGAVPSFCIFKDTTYQAGQILPFPPPLALRSDDACIGKRSQAGRSRPGNPCAH